MIETVVSGVNITQLNGPFELPIWDGSDGLREGQFAYDATGAVEPLAGPGTIWWDGAAWHRTGSTDEVPNLQQVTDEGAITSNSMAVRITGADGPVADLEVSANSGAALIMIRAARESGTDFAFIQMAGTRAQIAISNNVPVEFVNGTAAVLLTILADGSGTVDRNGVKRVSGTGNPEGVIAAMPGSTWSRIDGNPGETLYVKQSGNSTTGWAPIG